jgi:muramoyltetrapeptide carboxypeptidase LdcA involved in peptidoglycan recycling
MGMGERGMLEQFGAVLVGRPKAWSLENPTSPAEKRQYADDQRDAVLRALGEYNRSAPVVFGVDFGHTDPQLVIPNGGHVTVDAVARRVLVTY